MLTPNAVCSVKAKYRCCGSCNPGSLKIQSKLAYKEKYSFKVLKVSVYDFSHKKRNETTKLLLKSIAWTCKKNYYQRDEVEKLKFID